MIKLFLITIITYFVLLMANASLDFSDLKILTGYKLLIVMIKDIIHMFILTLIIYGIFLVICDRFNI